MEQYGQILSLVVLFGAFYLLMIRPQQKRQKEHTALVASLAEGDRVITIGGMYGSVRTIEGNRVGLEVAPGVIIEFDRSAVASKEQA
ncbi:MAG: preprotein translocase subunit YajC [Coriobacteriia bacterium]|nr:preprotein translocase subunit YajC [Coriobacteriia bacterium]MBN2839569.1 preprotein translocase subunit YajC [Coriobacteriia bacterium]